MNEIRDPAPKVYAAITAVTAAMASEGIGKDRLNTQQNYKFRGIDSVYNALSRTLSNHKLNMLPRVISRETVERASRSGGALFYTMLHVEFDLVSAEDGSKHTISVIGEAMDSADKSSNKAMSAAYKYAAFQAFCIPTEGDNDADATTHEVEYKNREGSVRSNRDISGDDKPVTQDATTISKAAAKTLTDAAKKAGLKMPTLLKAYSIESIDQLKAGDFESALKRITDYADRKAKENK